MCLDNAFSPDSPISSDLEVALEPFGPRVRDRSRSSCSRHTEGSDSTYATDRATRYLHLGILGRACVRLQPRANGRICGVFGLGTTASQVHADAVTRRAGAGETPGATDRNRLDARTCS